jgi:serine protease Do
MIMAAFLVSAADAQQVPQSRSDIAMSFSPVVKKVSPAVVNIYTRRRVQVADTPMQRDPFFSQLFGKGFNFGGRTKEQVVSSLGSGVIVKPDGLVVTSHHVIKDAQQVTVVLSDKREFEAKLVLKDAQSDLAFLRINPEGALPFVEIRDSDGLEVGDLVLAVGNPFGIGQTVTSGIISALARKAAGVSDYQFFIQTDAAINPGNSGGALVDMNGQLIGINTAIYSKTGGSVGIGFAIPSNMVRSLMNSDVQDGRVVRPWLGVNVQPVTAEIAESVGMPSREGAIIRKISAGSPALAAGLKVGDVIISVNGTPVSTDQEINYRLALSRLGEQARIGVLHDGKREEIMVKLAGPPENPKRDLRTLIGIHPLNGFTVANLSPALCTELGIDDETRTGVIVLAGSNTTIASTIAAGSVILQVNGTKVESTMQLEKILSAKSKTWQIVFQQGSNTMTLTVKMQ